ncbi:hypothetical protein JCM3765_006471 [Sporobolomyces pararoseus]
MSSASSPSPLGQCVVCGKESMKGCSSCKAVGLDWMYFCSVEHQRLIWKSHKLACGKNPFEYPSLSAKEVEDMWKTRHDPIKGSTSFSDATRKGTENFIRSENKGDEVALSNDEFDTVLKHLLTELSTEDTRGPAQQEALRVYRGSHFRSNLTKLEVQHKGLPAEEIRRYLRDDPIAFMAFIDQAVPHQISSSSWYQKSFRHRLFVFIGAMAVERRDERTRGSPAASWTIGRILDFSDEFVPQIDSESARLLNEIFVPRLLEVLGLSVRILSPLEQSGAV